MRADARWIAALLSLVLIGPVAGLGGTVTWNNTGSDWFTGTCWDSGNVPSNGDDVVIAAGALLLTNETATLSSLKMDGGTLTFSNWTTKVTATNVWINGGSVTLPAPFIDGAMSNRVWFSCTRFFLGSSATIAGDGRGYSGGLTNSQAGHGPGRGFATSGSRGSGGSYGGRAGDAQDRGGTSSVPYGVASSPTGPGSGGGVAANATAPGYVGGHGGGSIWVDATGVVTVNGTMSANGTDRTADNVGPGSGGSIYIVCDQLAATNGILRARGGNASASLSGGGGGGRIAVVFNPTSQSNAPAVEAAFQAHGGTGKHVGDPGTIYFPDSVLLPTSLTNNVQGQLVGFPSWSPGSLFVSNTWIRFAQDGFQLTVTNDMKIVGTGTRCDVGADRTLYYAWIEDSRGWFVFYNGGYTRPVLNIGGDLIVTNSASLYVYSASTNASVQDYGAFLGVTGTLMIGSSSTVAPVSNPTNGGSVLLRVGNLIVRSTGALRSDYGGWYGAYGLGKGATSSGPRGSGGGYGGDGGKSVSGALGGAPYGSATLPIHCGSGGGAYSAVYPGGRGGGLIRVQSGGNAVMEGVVSANGEACGNADGGGSGGGIFLLCRALSGNGSLTAAGGLGHVSYSGGGGGGRIALWRGSDTSTLTSNVLGGTGWSNGLPGTVAVIATAGVVTNLYATNETTSTAELVGELTYTGMAPNEVFCFWGTNDGGTVKSAWNTNTTLGVSGLAALTNSVSGLLPATVHYFRFYVTNAYADAWAPASTPFSTLGGASVNNDAGATDITATSATLHGIVTGGSPTPDAYVCWGDNDPGIASTSAWDHVTGAGPQIGAFSAAVSGLLANGTYYYRCYVTNANADGWAASATNFTTLSPALAIADATPVTEGNSGTVDLQFSVTITATSAVAVTVQFSSSNGTASAGSDYVETNGTLTLGAGSTSATITVVVNADTDDEYPSENLFVVLSNAVGATVSDTLAEGVITDDDLSPQTRTWSGTGLWTSASNWSPPGVPRSVDTVIIGSGESLLTGAVSVVDFTMNAGRLVFSNWTTSVTASNVLLEGGTVTLPAAFTDAGMSNRVWFVCTNFILGASAAIDVNSRGYSGGVTNNLPGNGPGKGQGNIGNRGTAGSYGGRGGEGDRGHLAGVIYGSPALPLAPGSGGGTAGGPGNVGGHGGGAVRIDAAAAVTLNGSILANGTDNPMLNVGPGSGGGVYITCRTVAATGGVIQARGGNGDSVNGWNGGGGGGRVAVVYEPSAQSLMPAASLALYVTGGSGAHTGDLGTIYLPDAQLLPTVMGSSFAGQVYGVSSWSPASLLVSNGWVRFVGAGFSLAVAGDLRLTARGRLDIGGDTFTNYTSTVETRGWCGYYNSIYPGPAVSVGGDVTVASGTWFAVYAAATNSVATNGATLSVAGTLRIATNATLQLVSNPTNGGSVYVQAQAVEVDAGGRINADYTGFGWSMGPGKGTSAGSRGSGGGFGGRGGNSAAGAVGGIAYGISNAPVECGSGGGEWGVGRYGGRGGGRIRMEVADTISVHGTLTASGEPCSDADGGGSGGSIYITCTRITGGGTIRANGGNGDVLYSGGGGGGRIAIWRQTRSFTGTLSVTNGISYPSASLALPGTIFWGQLPLPGSIFLIH